MKNLSGRELGVVTLAKGHILSLLKTKQDIASEAPISPTGKGVDEEETVEITAKKSG